MQQHNCQIRSQSLKHNSALSGLEYGFRPASKLLARERRARAVRKSVARASSTQRVGIDAGALALHHAPVDIVTGAKSAYHRSVEQPRSYVGASAFANVRLWHKAEVERRRMIRPLSGTKRTSAMSLGKRPSTDLRHGAKQLAHTCARLPPRRS